MHIIVQSDRNTEICFILSALIVGDPMLESPTTTFSELNVDMEEADLRLLPINATEKEHIRLGILANDTDIIVAFHDLNDVGLNALWVRGGVGKPTTYLPINAVVINLGTSLCQKLPAMHRLTELNSNSTKLYGQKQLPLGNLENFGEDPRLNCVEEMLHEVEKYLVKVLKAGSSAKAMDELRYQIYHHSKNHSFIDLAPTSFETTDHCLRAFFSICMLQCLNKCQNVIIGNRAMKYLMF